MKRVLLAVFLTVALAFGLVGCIDGTNVYVFGDSLVVQSKTALQQQAPGVNVQAFGGTSVCDWTTRLKAAADKQPKVVIASFVGNSYTQCAGGPTIGDNYWNSLFFNTVAVSKYFAQKKVQLYWAGYPVRGFPSIYVLGDWQRVQNTFKYAASQYPQFVHWFDAGLTVAPNHRYTATINGKTVRDPDQLHFTPYGGELYARELLKPAI